MPAPCVARHTVHGASCHHAHAHAGASCLRPRAKSGRALAASASSRPPPRTAIMWRRCLRRSSLRSPTRSKPLQLRRGRAAPLLGEQVLDWQARHLGTWQAHRRLRCRPQESSLSPACDSGSTCSLNGGAPPADKMVDCGGLGCLQREGTDETPLRPLSTIRIRRPHMAHAYTHAIIRR